MSESVNCNFARCAVRHFVSSHLTKNHFLPRGAILQKYNTHFASMQVRYNVASKRFTTISKRFNDKWCPQKKREEYLLTFNIEAWQTLSQEEKEKHTLSRTYQCFAKHGKKRVAIPRKASPSIHFSEEDLSTPVAMGSKVLRELNNISQQVFQPIRPGSINRNT